MSTIETLKSTVDEWIFGLDSGDLERMVATCDPEAVTCNEKRPTTIGIQAVRDKYGPRIEAATFKSGFDIQEIKIFGDFAVIVGHFSVEVTDKASGKKGGGEGRLVLGYRLDDNGDWKMALDIDNND
ncbi:YybH family protein [Rhodanobacter sp. Col0626]|uniref:YybH family protein n=1 Tax=Rhodanobacter sp. Col0626 TaxID=3415679 RepID=UPI003CEF6E34